MKTTKYSIELSDEAEVDFDKSYNYYFEDNPKIADALFKRINASIREIKKTPYLYPIAYKNLRKYIVRKFPFIIYYQIENSLIKIIAIFHSSRNPEVWNQRI